MNQVTITSSDLLTFTATFLALGLLLALGGLYSDATGWFSPLSDAKKAKYAPEVTHFFAFREHWGIPALVVLNGFLAWAVMLAWRGWNLPVFQVLLIVMLIVSVFMMQGWADGDNEPGKRVLSAFSRDGLLIVPGVLLAVSGGFAYTITVMYFLTPKTAGENMFPVIFAVALTLYLFVGLIQPPKHVWGEVHRAAWQQFFGGTFVVWVLATVKLLEVPQRLLPPWFHF